jgi:hypothetical protein
VSPARSRPSSPHIARSLSREAEAPRVGSQTRDHSGDNEQRRGRSTSSRRVAASSYNLEELMENDNDDNDNPSEEDDDATEAKSPTLNESDTIASRVRQRKRATSRELD